MSVKGDSGVTSSHVLPKRQEYRPVGACERPFPVVNADTGERQTVRCGSRLVRKCPSCAALARKDYKKLIESGFVDVDPALHRFYFLTLTAPSFGPTHHVPKSGDGNRKRCRCGVVHHSAADAGLRGVALDPRTYDYDGCVRWNYGLGRLWDATRSRLVKVFPRAAYAKVSEFQARGALHVHVMVRVPLAYVGRRDMAAALLDLTMSVSTRDGLAWGQQGGDCQLMRSVGAQGDSIGYMAKALAYVTKDEAMLAGVVDVRAREHFEHLDAAARDMPCDRCESWGERCGSLPHRRWGTRSSMLTRSRGSSAPGGRPSWSQLRRMDLHQRRIEFARRAERENVALETLARLVAEEAIAQKENEILRV